MISTKSKVNLTGALISLGAFLTLKVLLLLGMTTQCTDSKIFEHIAIGAFVFFFVRIARRHIERGRDIERLANYTKSLNSTLIEASHNTLLYEGNLIDGSKILTRNVSDSLKVDRCSIWMYDKYQTTIECEQMYDKSTDDWTNGAVLKYGDFKAYFDHLDADPIISASDAAKHPATSCFTENYLKPNGIKSMLDVPITYRGKTIGVICIESREKREWIEPEIDFAQILSSLYSFAYSISETNNISRNLREIESFMNSSVLVSKADKNGKITYVNQKFSDVSGWGIDEVIGHDHKIVNSGIHTDEFWSEMYNTTIKERKIWNAIVTNRTKEGKLYHVDTNIKANFDNEGKLDGFISIRQDITEIVELNDKLNSLLSTQTCYMLRTDMQGRHTYWNDKFMEEFGWVYGDNMMHGDALLSICKTHHGVAEQAVQECVTNPGRIVKVELDKPHKDGSIRTTLWEFVCILDRSGDPNEVQCMGIDITERKKAEDELVVVLSEVENKNTYLEHAAKIIRHDMHSGINTYIPRGIKSLERRLTEEQIKKLKIEAPMKMIKEGLAHTQRVYKGVYEFTNLVKKDSVLNKEMCDLRSILMEYLSNTAYSTQIAIDYLPKIEVNQALFCTAIDNLIRNSLKYNDSEFKMVAIGMDDESHMSIQDNGRGMTQEEFNHFSKPYTRKKGQKETGTGLGLNICVAILKEHGFSVTCDKNEIGTKIKIKLR